uniref:Uncharacterized protein n=1 Tax=Solanum lycopersicum TaxID=4081 RepID=A0A3Q7I8T8_SOLLC
MKFTDSPVIDLKVLDSQLAFHQDNGSMHVGTSVWPCSLVLVKFGERCLNFHNKGLFLLGLNNVVITDIAPVMPQDQIKSLGPPFDVVIAALVGENGVVLLGYQFDVEKVPHEHLHPEYAYEETDVYIFRKKKKL